jgi:hypothetical protein
MATASQRRKSRRPSAATLKEAMKRAMGPLEARVFPPAAERVGNQVGALLARGGSTAEVQKAWARLGKVAPPPMHVMDFPVGKQTVGERLRLLELLDGIYVPGNDTSFWVRPDHHYLYEGTTGGYADRMSGHVAASSNLDVTVPVRTLSGAIFSQIYTAPAQYGQVSQVSFDVDLSWEAAGRFLTAVPWGEKVMGTMRLLAQLFLTIFEFNVATSSWEGVVAIPRVVLDESWMGSGEYTFKYAGAISPGQFTAKCIVSPARYYAMGVQAQVTMFNNLKSTSPGQPVPPPPPNLYPAYAWLAASVPTMYINHQVFAW